MMGMAGDWWRRNTEGLSKRNFAAGGILTVYGVALLACTPRLTDSLLQIVAVVCGLAMGFMGIDFLVRLNHLGQRAIRVRFDAEARAQAETAATQLLWLMLTNRERTELDKTGRLSVPSQLYPDRVYRIPWANESTPISRLVHVIENGRRTMVLCVEPVDSYLPSGDHVLLHKWLIEGAEEEYLRRANKWHLTGIPA